MGIRIYQIIQIVDDVQGEIEDLMKNGDQNDPMVIGQLLAYAETLSIIKSVCICDADKIGLDCDMDAMIYGAVQNGKKVEFERTVRTRNLVKKRFSKNRPVKRETERSTPMNNIFTRVSIRKYQPKPVEPEKLEAILRAAMQAPSAANQQPWEFYVVTNKEKLAELSEVSPYAGMTKDAPVAIVAVYRRDCKLPDYAQIDMSIAMQNLWLETDAQGLGGVWLGIAPIEERMQAVEQVLELPERVRAFAIFPLGYPAETRKQQDRFDLNRIHFVE